jgi:integrase
VAGDDGAEQRPTWDEVELRAFLAEADTDRLAPLWRALAYGLRRGEASGLAWDGMVQFPRSAGGGAPRRAVDLDAGTITIGPTRVMVDGHPVDKPTPKSRHSYRTLDLDAVLAAQLRALRDLQRIEAIDAGGAYAGGRLVASNELGQPISPEWVTNEFYRIAERAGLPRIHLHDTRGTMNQLMENAGVAETFRSAWLGHSVEVNRGAYLRRPRDLSPVTGSITAILGTVTEGNKRA